MASPEKLPNMHPKQRSSSLLSRNFISSLWLQLGQIYRMVCSAKGGQYYSFIISTYSNYKIFLDHKFSQNLILQADIFALQLLEGFCLLYLVQPFSFFHFLIFGLQLLKLITLLISEIGELIPSPISFGCHCRFDLMADLSISFYSQLMHHLLYTFQCLLLL